MEQPDSTGVQPEGGQFPIPSERELSTVVIQGVADTLDEEMENLDPLHDVVDVDALNSLFSPADSQLTVQFVFNQCQITIDRGTTIAVAPLDDAD